MSRATTVSAIDKTNGRSSSEHAITWITMLAAIGAVVAQVGAKLWLEIDLGINIDLALATGFGSGAAYTMARMVVKTGISFAEGKVKAAAASKPTEGVTAIARAEAARSPFAVAAPAPASTILPPKNIPPETRAW